MTFPYSATKGFSHWLKIDYATLLENILIHAADSDCLDLCAPFYKRIWSYLEDDIIRSGIKSLISVDPELLLTASSSLKKILGPGVSPGAHGYAKESLIPVLGSFSDCLSLSNMAQMHDCRMPFMLRFRSSTIEAVQSDDILEGICERLPTLPMLDLCGFFSHYPVRTEEISALRGNLAHYGLDKKTFYSAAGESGEKSHNVSRYINWQAFALGKNKNGVFPCEIGFWATPVKSGMDYQLFLVDMGLAHGLCNDFPATIGGYDAKVVEVFERHCEMIIQGNHQGPWPVKGFLTGGPAHKCVALERWKESDLRNLLIHLGPCPVYLEKNARIIEILPGFSA